ncbi:hypothetical protein [Halobacterium wangiae]|uniref:hypothetical protein n=1 Tax=Halobacterium wangiae TaxID=2902623 RepID=UPI001E3E0AC5|nr:hypothetical protein [Halobacterium wangiae]
MTSSTHSVLTQVLVARRLELALVALAATLAFVLDGPGAVAIAAVVGFFVAKSVDSLRRTLA